jgi:uncharacterized protein YkwD
MKTHWTHTGLSCSLVILLFAGCTSNATNATPNDPSVAGQVICATPNDELVLAMEVLRLVNVERDKLGLDPVEWSDQLAQISHEYACDMIQGQFFSHVNPITGEGPGERAIKGGYLFRLLGENLAVGFNTAEIVMSEWMDSPDHRANILNPTWKEMGVGIRIGTYRGVPNTVYWTQEFGDPI